MDVRRKRHVADLLENGAKFWIGREAQDAFAIVPGGEDFGFQERRVVVRSGKLEALARLNFAAGSYEGGPFMFIELLGEENLDAASGIG